MRLTTFVLVLAVVAGAFLDVEQAEARKKRPIKDCYVTIKNETGKLISIKLQRFTHKPTPPLVLGPTGMASTSVLPRTTMRAYLGGKLIDTYHVPYARRGPRWHIR